MTCMTTIPLLLTAGAAGMDLMEGKVDNRWLLFGLAAGCIARLQLYGPAGMPEGLLGLLAAFALTGWLHIFHMLGAGDIKLICVLGFFLGPGRILLCLFYSLIAGAAVSLWILYRRGILMERANYFMNYAQEVIRTRQITPYLHRGMERPENIHFTIPVLCGLVLGVLGWY